MDKTKIIVGIGELLWDIFPERKVIGGAPANFAYHVSQLGYSGYAVSALGNDLLGKEILDIMENKQLNYVVETTNYPTGTVQVTLDKEKVPQYEICENVAWDNIPFSSQTENLAKNAHAVCFGSLAQRNSISRNTIKRFVKATPDSSLKIFDINLRQHFYSQELIHESLKIANILKINDDEVAILSRLYGWKSFNEQQICVKLMKLYKLKIVILTKGSEGSFIFNNKETSFLPTPKVHVADTVGAGDSFTGAFIASYLNGESIIDAHKLAVEISAYVCTQYGAMPVLPDEYIELLKNRTPYNSL